MKYRVDIKKIFRRATLENPKYQFYKFPYSDDEDVMLIKKKNRNSWWDDVELTDDVQKNARYSMVLWKRFRRIKQTALHNNVGR